jgi:CcmD family protein
MIGRTLLDRLPVAAALLVLLIVASDLPAQSEVAPPRTEPAALIVTGQGEPADAAGRAGVAVQTQPAPGVPSAPGQPPRTLRAYWHLFIAFAVTWLLLFGYMITVGRRWARLEREVRDLAK